MLWALGPLLLLAAPIGQEGAPREVLFTFDDGPKVDTTPKVLAELERRGIKAVFFVVGRKFEKDEKARELLRSIVKQGHYVGNHTYSHRVLCQNLDLAPHEIDRNQHLIEEVLGIRPLLLRTPYGQHCKRLRKIVADRGFEQIGWDIDAQEWLPGSRGAKVAKFIIGRLEKLRGRGIVLMHDTRQATVDALPIVLEWLAAHPEIKVLDWSALLPTQKPMRSHLLDALREVGNTVVRALPRSRGSVAAFANLVL